MNITPSNYGSTAENSQNLFYSTNIKLKYQSVSLQQIHSLSLCTIFIIYLKDSSFLRLISNVLLQGILYNLLDFENAYLVLINNSEFQKQFKSVSTALKIYIIIINLNNIILHSLDKNFLIISLVKDIFNKGFLTVINKLTEQTVVTNPSNYRYNNVLINIIGESTNNDTIGLLCMDMLVVLLQLLVVVIVKSSVNNNDNTSQINYDDDNGIDGVLGVEV